ncbi:MAG: hypothetical protein RLN85_03050, partial [Pseudomonadales bacterium]
MCIVNDNGVRIRNVQSTLYNVCGNQHVKFTFNKLEHDFFELRTFHLTMGNPDSGVWHQLIDHISYLLNVAHPVVNHENLTSPSELMAHSITNHLFIILMEFGG